MRRRPRAAALLLLVAAAAAAAEPAPLHRPAAAPVAADPRAEAGLFAMPEIAEAGRAAAALVEAGDPAAAAARVEALAAAHPEAAAVPLMRAELALLAGDPGAALDALGRATALGADVRPALGDRRLAAAADDPRLAALAALPAAASTADGDLPASHAQMESFFAQLAETLDAIDFHKGRAPESAMRKLRRLFLRAGLDDREVRILRGILADAQRMARLAGERGDAPLSPPPGFG